MNAIIAMKSAQIINNERNETELMTEGIYQMTGFNGTDPRRFPYKHSALELAFWGVPPVM